MTEDETRDVKQRNEKVKLLLIRVGFILIVVALCLGVGFIMYGKQKSKQVRQIMNVVYKHDPTFGEISEQYPYPRITRLAPNGKDWLVLNTWDVNDENGRYMLDGQYFMIIRDGKVIEYQNGRVSNFLATKFLCRALFNEKTSRWIYDESGKRTSCVDNSYWKICMQDNYNASVRVSP